jgi:hypothetical protein
MMIVMRRKKKKIIQETKEAKLALKILEIKMLR